MQRQSRLGSMSFLGLNISSVGSKGFSSLTEQCTQLFKDYNILITKKGLNDRFNKNGVKFIKRVFESILGLSLTKELEISSLAKFSGIYIKDATGKQLPECYINLFKGSGGSSSKAGLKVDFSYNILGDETEMALRDGASSDANSPLMSYKKDSLYLWDLGYFYTQTFKEVIQSDAFFISRYKVGVNLYQDFKQKCGKIEQKLILVKDLTRNMRVNQIENYTVYLGSKEHLEVRLVIQKLPKKIADKRKRRLKKSCKKTPSSERLKSCEYTIMITNIKEEDFKGENILKIYGIRWQIEILFKGWKSVMKFGNVHAMKTDRFLCMLYGHLTWITLTMKIISWNKITLWNQYKIQLSELKAFKVIKLFHENLLSIFRDNDFDLTEVIQKIGDALFLFAEKESKKQTGKHEAINLFSIG